MVDHVIHSWLDQTIMPYIHGLMVSHRTLLNISYKDQYKYNHSFIHYLLIQYYTVEGNDVFIPVRAISAIQISSIDFQEG